MAVDDQLEIATAMFRLDQAGKTYSSTVALHPTSLCIGHGERVALMGPSGSGKSTMLRLLARVILPDSGKVHVQGRPTSELEPGSELARMVGIMPQSLDLVLTLSVANNVAAGRLGEWGFFRSALSLVVPQESDRIEAALSRVGIPEKLHERTAHLSGGQQQRVALARLLVQEPRAILADEPVASVDPARAEDLIALLVSLVTENQQTLVASLHSVQLALRHFSRVIALRDGRVVFDRPVEDVTDADLSALYTLGAAADGSN